MQGESLYKKDSLLANVENLVSNRRAWTPIRRSRKTKRTEPETKLVKWIQEQMARMRKFESLRRESLGAMLSADEFPIDTSGKRVIATSRRILYLIDSTEDFLHCMGQAFGPQVEAKARTTLSTDIPAFIFVTNSVESGGRAFSGDPFTGQVAAFSMIFGYNLVGERERNVITYYPHQLYSQFFTIQGKRPNNKGANVLQSQVDLVITSKGVLIEPKSWTIL